MFFLLLEKYLFFVKLTDFESFKDHNLGKEKERNSSQKTLIRTRNVFAEIGGKVSESPEQLGIHCFRTMTAQTLFCSSKC